MTKDGLKKAIREALADYVRSEGCSCCRNNEEHDAAARRLAKLLEIPLYKDESGVDWNACLESRQ